MLHLGGYFEILYGTTSIGYELTFSKRKTLAIHVYPDTSVVVDAPLNTSPEQAEEKVRKRAPWILRQWKELENTPPPAYRKRFVSGESYRYLGRQYMLKVIEDTSPRVRLSSQYIQVYVPDKSHSEQVQSLLLEWYSSRAKFIFKERLDLCYSRIEPLGVAYPRLAIRDMKLRWGSCSPSGLITLNLKLIQVPGDYLDYVIIHELCHLKEPNHSPAFYALLNRVLPVWRETRAQLNAFELELL